MSHQRIDPTDDGFDQWLDESLTSPAARVAAPADLRFEVHRALRRKRIASVLLRGVAAAAAVWAAVALWPRSVEVNPQHQAVTAAEDAVPTIAIFIPSDDVIAIEHRSPAPNVTVIEFYPTTSAQRHWARQALLDRTSTSYDGG